MMHVYMPSDYMTKNEIKKMNGEVISYNLSKPMSWKAFNNLSDDIAREYIANIRKKYSGVSDSLLAKMFNMSYTTVHNKLAALGIEATEKRKSGQLVYNRKLYEEFLTWCGIEEDTTADDKTEESEDRTITEEERTQEMETPTINLHGGQMECIGNIDQIGRAMYALLGGGLYKFKIAWEVND